MNETKNELETLQEKYEADMHLFDVTLRYLRDCVERQSLQEALMVIDVTQSIVDVARAV